MTEAVNHPSHYCQFRHEVIELAELLNFNNGNVVKYVCRAPYKGNAQEDLKKAIWYLRRELDRGVDEIWTDAANRLVLEFCRDLDRAGHPHLANALIALQGHQYMKAVREIMREGKEDGE